MDFGPQWVDFAPRGPCFGSPRPNLQVSMDFGRKMARSLVLDPYLGHKCVDFGPLVMSFCLQRTPKSLLGPREISHLLGPKEGGNPWYFLAFPRCSLHSFGPNPMGNLPPSCFRGLPRFLRFSLFGAPEGDQIPPDFRVFLIVLGCFLGSKWVLHMRNLGIGVDFGCRINSRTKGVEMECALVGFGVWSPEGGVQIAPNWGFLGLLGLARAPKWLFQR